MLKTRLGISVGLMGALMFFVCLFGNYLVSILLAGYILLFEENIWLKKASVKAIALMILFSLASILVGLIPNLLGFIADIVRLFDGYFNYTFITNLEYAISSALGLVETVLFLILGWKSLHQGTIKLPIVDNLINKYMA